MCDTSRFVKFNSVKPVRRITPTTQVNKMSFRENLRYYKYTVVPFLYSKWANDVYYTEADGGIIGKVIELKNDLVEKIDDILLRCIHLQCNEDNYCYDCHSYTLDLECYLPTLEAFYDFVINNSSLYGLCETLCDLGMKCYISQLWDHLPEDLKLKYGLDDDVDFGYETGSEFSFSSDQDEDFF